MTARKIQQVIPGMPASDGAGVKLIRSLGSANHLRLDPFLMLDAFSSENPDDTSRDSRRIRIAASRR